MHRQGPSKSSKHQQDHYENHSNFREGSGDFKGKTEVHRTQIIFGLEGQRVAAERRRFDVGKIIDNQSNTNQNPHTKENIGQMSYSRERVLEDVYSDLSPKYEIDEDQSDAKSFYCESDGISSRYSRNSRSSVRETVYSHLTRRYRSSLSSSHHPGEDFTEEYDSDGVEDYSSSEDLSPYKSTTHSSEDDTDDNNMSNHHKSIEYRYCCRQTRGSLIAFGVAFIVMIVAGTFVLLTNAFESDLILGFGLAANSTDISFAPSIVPTLSPSEEKESVGLSFEPSLLPAQLPSKSLAPTVKLLQTKIPTWSPSFQPSPSPSKHPSLMPSIGPSQRPTDSHTLAPSNKYTESPTNVPSFGPSQNPSKRPTLVPSIEPSGTPSTHPSIAPTLIPTTQLSNEPSVSSSTEPSNEPSVSPSTEPSNEPSVSPSTEPSNEPSVLPSFVPTYSPTKVNEWFEVRGRLYGKTHASDFYGRSVALSKDGNTLAVSNFGQDEAEVYGNINNQWVMRGVPIVTPAIHPNLYAVSGPEYSAMQVDLSASGNIVAVGGSGYNSSRGIVRVFQWDGTAWTQMGQSMNGLYFSHDWFGESLALAASGLDIAIGARKGRSEVYHFDGVNWVRKGLPHFEEWMSGLAWNRDSIAMTDDGAYYAVSAIGGEFVLVFKWDGNEWVQVGQTLKQPEHNNDEYGSGIDLVKLPSGVLTVAIVISRLNEGEVRIYDFDFDDNNTDWVERSGRITSPGSRIIGQSLRISDDGNSIVTCTYKDVVMFDWNGSEWILRSIVMETLGVSDDEDNYGKDFWFAMSGDSSIVAVGMPNDEDTKWNGDNLGQVRTFSMERPY